MVSSFQESAVRSVNSQIERVVVQMMRSFDQGTAAAISLMSLFCPLLQTPLRKPFLGRVYKAPQSC